MPETSFFWQPDHLSLPTNWDNVSSNHTLVVPLLFRVIYAMGVILVLLTQCLIFGEQAPLLLFH
jgi:hypothetical protein